MNPKLVVSENTSAIWKPVIYVSLFSALLFLLLFFMISAPLLGGVFRLGAFIGLAAAILAFLQLQGATRTIEIEFDKKNLIVSYILTSKKNQEELFERKTIKAIQEEKPPAAWGILPQNDSSKFVITFTDTSNSLSLFRFQGHDIFISKNDAKKLQQFLIEHL